MTTDELLQALREHYGPAFNAGEGDSARVFAEWDDARRHMVPASVHAALANLPPTPVNPWGFRALGAMHARSVPQPGDGPTPRQQGGLTSERLLALDRLRGAQRAASRDPLAWARRLREREQSGERLTPFIASLWRDVLKGEA